MSLPPSAAPARRAFFLPTLGLVVLFAALGPAVGAAVFIPLAMLLEAQTQAATHIGWIAGLVGHAFALIPAYVLGFLPAAFTGLCYALYDAWAPPAAPRALGAAVIGGLLAQGLYIWLLGAGAEIGAWISVDLSDAVGDVVNDWSTGEIDASLHEALVVCGAVAGFACATTARLFGLKLRG